MDDVLLLPLAFASLAAAIYAHLRLADFVRGQARTTWLRVFLIVLGFGLAHVPPAFVLMLKRLRGEGRS